MTFAHIMPLISHIVTNLPHRSKWDLKAYHPSLLPCEVPNTLLRYIKRLPIARGPEIVPVRKGIGAVGRYMRRGSAVVDCAVQGGTGDGSVQDRIDCVVSVLGLFTFSGNIDPIGSLRAILGWA